MGLTTNNNLKNAILSIIAPLPSIFFYLYFLNNYSNPNHTLSFLWTWCYNHPFLLTFVLFFLNINVLFWAIAHLQSSHWMIDPYWPAVPVMLVYYYATHPCASYNPWRSKIVITMTSLWSLRLSHNYFRRENWQWGAKEDWRFTDMRHQYGKNWWWVSFFTIYFAQQIFLMGVTLPYYIIHTVEAPWSIWDVVAISMCMTGIILAYYADTELHEFSTKNAELKASEKPIIPILDKGLWQYSRHPNYFGEQLWWWGIGIFAWSLGYGWVLIGALVNSLCLAYVTTLVEDRMLKQSFRADAYREYQKRTSVWIPWFKSSSSLAETKDKTN
ncbi:hypothetical protein RND81_03G227200 [Saponaria officinalis]|uniref:Steroid 5-alpha reductase C-terminal domain-containing protein n=1 Tax=Saponaria officinalis TaxID=3572 RepID=A0AAW1MAN0_SAPOF